MTELNLKSHLVRSLIDAGGVIESGAIANMRTYLLPMWAKTHTRILGLDKTLCGRSLRNHGQLGWQFYHRGLFGRDLPSGTGTWERNHCTVCAKSPVLSITEEVVVARRKAFMRLK